MFIESLNALQRITAMKRCRLKRYNFQIKNKMSKEKNTSDKQEKGNDFIADVSSSAHLKVGDKIDIGGFITKLEEIKYDPYVRINLYWFYNENGEYKYNVREGVTKV